MTGFRHVVTFQFHEDATDDQIAAVTRGLETLPGLIPEIADYRVGPDAGINEYLVYRDHPAHLGVIAEHIRPILASRAAVQYVI